MSGENVGCAKPTAKINAETSIDNIENKESKKEITMVTTARAGSKAPDFEASAFHKGKFITVKLSDYCGKWVIVCFYPGDFTFV